MWVISILLESRDVNTRKIKINFKEFPLADIPEHVNPLMLLYLNNDKNLSGSVNENYARELMELFSLGTHRTDPLSGDRIENYIEYRNDGRRTDGDIYRIARRLTGWRVVPLLAGDGLLYWRSVYSAADHDPTPNEIFEGTPWTFTAQTDEDVVRGIYANHPAAAQHVARRLLMYYLTPQPPEALVLQFAQVIKEANYKLEQPMAQLLSSKAFYHKNYKNTLVKSSFQVAAQIPRILELARNDIGNLNEEVGVNVNFRELDLMSMGYVTTDPPTVFFFPTTQWTSVPTLMATANYVMNLLSDVASTERLSGWSTQTILPAGAAADAQVIDAVAAKIGITLNADQKNQIKFYLNNTYDGTSYRQIAYDNTLAAHQNNKGKYLYWLMAMMPDFLMK